MLKVAFGQSKMTKRPIAFILHLLVYVGFVIINIELLEMVLDGLIGTHRLFSPLGAYYNFLIACFEWLALGVLFGCLLFLIRRNIIHIKRFFGTEMTSWPKTDANLILLAEIALMTAFLFMNAADYKIQILRQEHPIIGAFPISRHLFSLLPAHSASLHHMERLCWWFHIIGVLTFLNYLPYSKHLHIILAFPNTYFSNLNPKGQLANMPAITPEVKAMLDPSYVPSTGIEQPLHFGAKDVPDLTWKNLLDAYTCTECGRCTAVCPANLTGKLLSPRKIMMDTRDRMVEIGRLTKQNAIIDDDKTLLGHYITKEEIWACTTCNACTEACPVTINPLEIILELRRYLAMEESQVPTSIQTMFGNIENNGAPWKYAQADRVNWRTET
ncbi:(Fe-S)-binding protein [Olivibacter ginsenosidimutans]|uniref:(Fe-S)-binding protein n=2 Tax=Olivibacter ginsenosidimutans TaxID=1176537 RepID=A0ABP9AJ60_9SPHI